ncbi:hypothetical protein cypCar_00050166 [Cyprinus carpio]|nr:hypothetical protein cypCar_00050166 [Cyprinus carpio]
MLCFKQKILHLVLMVTMLCVCLCAEHFTCVVKVLYSLQYTQALAALSVRFSREERLAWSKKVLPITYSSQPPNTPNSDKSWESLLCHMISELTKAKDVYDTNSEETLVVSHMDLSAQQTSG